MRVYYYSYVFLLLITTRFVEMTNESNRIVGGSHCQLSDYPFIVSLRWTSNLHHFCGGSLISRKWVLSAAHCFVLTHVQHTPWLVTVMLGESRSDRKDGQKIQAERIYVHKNFSNTSLVNDISLLLLNKEVSLIKRMVGLINLPAGNLSEDLSMHINDSRLTIAGWGTTKQVHKNQKDLSGLSQQLKCVNVPFITYKQCRNISRSATRKHICTYSEKGGEESCKGDSGGPLFNEGVVYGIVSWSPGCALPKMPGFNTRVDKYIDYIEETMRSSGTKKPSLFYSISIILNVYWYANKFDIISAL